ncbi:MAG: alpha/beta hydrolase [Actinobacteria bacterium]|nr:alpha/beta hydrolase [Actinomycetota bacterium]
MRKKYLIGLIVFISIIVSVVSGFITWTQFYYKPTEQALKYLVSDDKVEISIEKDIIFLPKNESTGTGFIFYPGAKVDERAYSYIGYMLAQKGHTVIIAKMPLRLAIFKTGAAEGIIEKNPGIERWFTGGHSLGGAAAAIYTSKNTGIIEGLVFLASYPAGSSDLSKTTLSALSITGSNDGIIDLEGAGKTENLLPEDTEFVEIDGGNHSQFGDYGLQEGDNAAAISIEKQHAAVIENIILMLDDRK